MTSRIVQCTWCGAGVEISIDSAMPIGPREPTLPVLQLCVGCMGAHDGAVASAKRLRQGGPNIDLADRLGISADALAGFVTAAEIAGLGHAAAITLLGHLRREPTRDLRMAMTWDVICSSTMRDGKPHAEEYPHMTYGEAVRTCFECWRPDNGLRLTVNLDVLLKLPTVAGPTRESNYWKRFWEQPIETSVDEMIREAEAVLGPAPDGIRETMIDGYRKGREAIEDDHGPCGAGRFED